MNRAVALICGICHPVFSVPNPHAEFVPTFTDKKLSPHGSAWPFAGRLSSCVKVFAFASFEEQLKAVTIIHPDMADKASDIARILERGRADTLKEAINLALEDDRKATEEMNRQAEAQRLEAILERQAQDARRHQMEMEEAERAHNKAVEEETRRNNAAMEREARAHNEAMHRAVQESNRIAEDRNRHAREQSRASARQNEFTASDGHRCQKCKNRFGCSRDIHNCGAFVSER